ncbi:hypothetical protein [Diaminobutyricimonas sp. TR449]|uniref:hypothetical protein n=1 Tax=Diaminobutyricimonas sp. TR449 TaxID=2708076 RepID=UPI001422C759|nr:hypothetical protein [Diaminobutyricimonas sp. TR449]
MPALVHPVLLVGVITAVAGDADSKGLLTGGRNVEITTDLGPVDVFVDPEHGAEQFVLNSPAALPALFLDTPSCGTQFRFDPGGYAARLQALQASRASVM